MVNVGGGTAGDHTAPADLVARDVHKWFGDTEALRGASVHVEAGRMLALLGPSGCGKTTLLRTIAGLERPEAGSIEVGGRVLTGPDGFVPPERRRIGMVFQDWALFPHLTVGRNVAYGVGKTSDRDARVEQALAMVGLAAMGDRSPGTLSGGQQQRVALARALAPEPSVLLLDEPFSNLDTALRVQVRGEVHRLLADLGVTTVFVTHDQEEAFVLGDEVAVMTDGAVVQQASPAELYAAPASRWVAEFVGDANLVPGRAQGRRVETAVGPVELEGDHDGAVDVLLRPEELRVAAPGGPVANGGHRAGGGVVELIEFYGHDTVYLVRLTDGPVVRVRAGSAPAHGRGDEVTVSYAGRPARAYTTDS
jgi:iron(III) transport system ATP-binding protein